MQRDYYEVLGVERDADTQTLRRAYRRLAKVHHPDVNPEDPESALRFKEISEAYEVLREPSTRAAYDRFGHAAVNGAAGRAAGAGFAGFDDLSDILEGMFGFGARGGRRSTGPMPEQGSDQRVKLRLSFEEAVFGAHRKVDVVRRETCDTCRGSGAAPGTKPESCSTCEGAGQVRRVRQSMLGSIVNVETCASCRGSGQTVSDPCETCRGRGRSQRARTLEIDVPAGVEKNTQMRVAGQGEHGLHGGPPGDLYVVLDVESHPTFHREGDDLHLEVRVNPADAALGAMIEVPTLEGDEEIRIPEGTQTGDTVRIPQRGVPHVRAAGRGDLIVRFHVMTPDKLSTEQRELLEQLRRTLPRAEVMARGKAGFWERVRERFT